MRQLKINYREAVIDDIPALIKLINSQYSRKKSKDYFLWQFFESVYPTILVVAENKNKIVGMFGLQKRKLTNNASVGQAIDMLIDPNYRGLGIFYKMIDYALEKSDQLDAICVLPNLNGKNAVAKLGWKNLTKIDELVLSGNIQSKECNLTNRNEKKIQFRYSNKVKNWRFNKHPQYKYFYNFYNSSNFIISKIFEDYQTDEKFGDIVYYQFNKNSNSMRKEFINTIKFFNSKGINSITTWALPNSVENELLTQIGFIPKSRERYFCLKILNKKYEFLYDVNNWKLFQSDAEIY